MLFCPFPPGLKPSAPGQRPGTLLSRSCILNQETRRPVAGTRACHPAGFTLVEILVVVAIIGVLIGLLLPAVQKVREAGNRIQCANNLKQIGIALHSYHDAYQSFPQAYDARALFVNPSQTPLPTARGGTIVTKSWMTLILPFVEQNNLDNAGYDRYHQQPLAIYVCPSDQRATGEYLGAQGFGKQALTDYLAVTGTKTFIGNPQLGIPRPKCDGVIYESSHTRIADITDGTSNTVVVGERPPSPDLFWGWWTWSAFDASLGVRDTFAVYDDSGGQPPIPCARFFPENFRPGGNSYCDTHHFWSPHPGGGNWLFADGGVRFLPYEANTILPALATRCGGEVVNEATFLCN